MYQGIEIKVKNRIFGHGRGWVFTPNHFFDLGKANSVRQALFQIEKKNIIRRITQGVYYYPRKHKLLGLVAAGIEDIVKAISEKNGAKILPIGAYAANIIGLSNQVPGRAIFITDGPSKKFKIGKLEIIINQVSVKNMHAAGSREALVIQAFKFMGKNNIEERELNITKRFLKETTRREFEKNLKFAPEWIRETLFKLMEDEL